MTEKGHSLIIGAGIGGLTAAALLLRAGHRVTVLEAHIYPGGSAGTFYHKKYLFDAGATLAGGLSPGGPHDRIGRLLDLKWPVSPVDPAWVVHLPDGRSISQWSDPLRWREEWSENFPDSAGFWPRQEMLAALSWDLASRPVANSTPFPWPPQSLSDFKAIASAFRPTLLKSLPYINRSVGDLAPSADPLFRTFLDAQLLISAQALAAEANALYGSAALDLPRRGVHYVYGGMGSLAKTLASWIKTNGGQVYYRHKAASIEVRNGRAVRVETEKGRSFEADNIIANVTPWALVTLLNESAPDALRRTIQRKSPTWGAFTLYLGLKEALLPDLISTHHQVIADLSLPLGEGNSVFISLADPNDRDRAPEGYLPATLSTHTEIQPWWQLFKQDREAYDARREQYTERMLAAADSAIPGIRQAVSLSLPGTPIDFAYYTGRPLGMVGGFPQTSLLSALGPRTGIPNLYLVGDSIFPGQSTAAVTLGAMRVADLVARQPARFLIPLPLLSSPLLANK